MTARQSIENLWDRATPVGPLLDAYRAEVLREAADDRQKLQARVAELQKQYEPHLTEEDHPAPCWYPHSRTCICGSAGDPR